MNKLHARVYIYQSPWYTSNLLCLLYCRCSMHGACPSQNCFTNSPSAYIASTNPSSELRYVTPWTMVAFSCFILRFVLLCFGMLCSSRFRSLHRSNILHSNVFFLEMFGCKCLLLCIQIYNLHSKLLWFNTNNCNTNTSLYMYGNCYHYPLFISVFLWTVYRLNVHHLSDWFYIEGPHTTNSPVVF